MIELAGQPTEAPHIALTIKSYPQTNQTNVTGPLNEPAMCLGLLAQGVGIVMQQIEKQGHADAVLALKMVLGNLAGIANHLGREQAVKPRIIAETGGLNGNALRTG
jgi:hypothetical protein